MPGDQRRDAAPPSPLPPAAATSAAPSSLTVPKPGLPDLSGIEVEGLILRRAETEAEVQAAQALRYRVFYDERGAHPVGEMGRLKRDYDQFDPVAHHLLVIDDQNPVGEKVVGTYRLMLEADASAAGLGLYSESRYDLTALRRQQRSMVELSRSCVLDSYRRRATIALLWSGIAAYFFHYQLGYMIGIVSFAGNDVSRYDLEFAYLRQHHLAPEAIRPVVKPEMYVPMPERELTKAEQRQALRMMPPLVRGYLTAGAKAGDGVMIDEQFNTIVACMVLDTDAAPPSFRRYYERKEGRRT